MLQFNKKEKLFNLKGIAVSSSRTEFHFFMPKPKSSFISLISFHHQFHILWISPGVFYLNCSWAIQFWSLPLISTQGLSFSGLMDWYRIPHTKCSLPFVIILGMWVSITEDQFPQSVQGWWAKWGEKPVGLWTSTMLPLMSVYHLCSHNQKSLVPKWVQSIYISFSSVCD